MNNEKLNEIINELQRVARINAEAIKSIACLINDYADFLEYTAWKEEIDKRINQAIENGWADGEKLTTPKQRLDWWKKMEKEEAMQEVMKEAMQEEKPEDYCECANIPDRLCLKCEREMGMF